MQAYKLVTENNFEMVKTIFMDAWKFAAMGKTKPDIVFKSTVDLLMKYCNFTFEQAKSLYNAEFNPTTDHEEFTTRKTPI